MMKLISKYLILMIVFSTLSLPVFSQGYPDWSEKMEPIGSSPQRSSTIPNPGSILGAEEEGPVGDSLGCLLLLALAYGIYAGFKRSGNKRVY